jgi:hypothetical protein
MRFKLKTRLLPVALVSIFAVATSVYAEGDHHGYGHSVTSTRLFANPVSAAGQGEIKYTIGSNGSSLQAGFTLPVDGTTLLDSNAAVAANLSLQFPNANVTCTLFVEDIYLKYPHAPSTAAPKESADYELSVSATSSKVVTANLGNCVTTGTTTPALPVVVSGDPVNVILNGNATPILTANFK